MIYKYCLIHHEEIDPHPSNYDSPLIKEQSLHTRTIFRDLKKRLNERIGYSKEWPSVSLLGVNKTIRHEAATILFGKNVWSISDTDVYEKNIWETYRSYFRHIATSFDMCDVRPNPLVVPSNKNFRCRPKGDEVSCESEVMRKHAHELQFLTMLCIWSFKVDLLLSMQLDSLVLNVDHLLCPRACCRLSMIEYFCTTLGKQGPWCQSEPASRRSNRHAESDTQGTSTKRYTDVNVVGLRNLEEAQVVQKLWGLDIDDQGELPIYRKPNAWQRQREESMYQARSRRGREQGLQVTTDPETGDATTSIGGHIGK